MQITQSHKGFSIIELMVSVAIIGILTAIITANLAVSKSKSRDAKRVSDIVQMQLALELFFDRCNRYPVVETLVDRGVSINVPKLSDTGNGCPTGILLSTFTAAIPNAPTAGDYAYAVSDSNQTDYVLRAKLENVNSALTDDVDTNPVYTLDCSDSPTPYYCVQPR
jgi:prepilin-type N-terminal cleavage/methylation domain-containing protein